MINWDYIYDEKVSIEDGIKELMADIAEVIVHCCHESNMDYAETVAFMNLFNDGIMKKALEEIRTAYEDNTRRDK